MRQVLNLSIIALATFVVAGCSSVDQAAQQRSLYVDSHPELSELMAEAILNGQIMVGMSEEMVHASWGKPARTESVNDDPELTTHWIYGNYFVGGTLTELYFDRQGRLARYEVNKEPITADGGELRIPPTTSRTGTLQDPMSKGSGP